MVDLEVFDFTVLQDLGLRTWLENDAFAALLRESTASITNDGRLLLWSTRASPTLRSGAFDVFNSIRAAGEHELLVPGGFGLKVFYRDKLYWGNFLCWRHLPAEPRSYAANDPDPWVGGHSEDQEPGHSAVTVVSNKRIIAALRDKWKAYLSLAGGGSGSSLRIAASGTAIQLHVSCETISIESLIDILVSGAVAIKNKRDSSMILGRSFTRVVTSPVFRKDHVIVDEEYGPFKSV
jgi:hypothetical protein